MKKKLIFFADDPGSKLFMYYLLRSLKKFETFFISNDDNSYMTNIKVSIKIDEKNTIYKIYKKLKPDLIFLSFCNKLKVRRMNEQLSVMAHKDNVKVIAVSDSIKNLNSRYWNKNKFSIPDLLIVTDKKQKQNLKKRIHKKNFYSGHPHYESLLSQPNKFFKKKIKNISVETKKIVFVDEPDIYKHIDEHDESLGNANKPRSDILIPYLINFIKDFKKKNRYYNSISSSEYKN